MNDNEEVWTFSIPAYRRGEFDHKIEIANRRLERAGVAERFRPNYVAVDRKSTKGGYTLEDGTQFGGIEVTEPWYEITMDTFTLAIGDYTFVAALVAEEAGYTVHSAPGQNLDGWKRPDVKDIHCDHCGTIRNRNRLYIIRNNANGELLQIGHNCIALYLGVSPKGLWALQYDEELQAFASEDSEGSSYGSGDYGIPVNWVLGYAYAFSDQGRSYVSRARAEASYGAVTATGQVVRAWLLYPPSRPTGKYVTAKDIAQWEAEREMARQGREYAEDATLISDIRSVAETLKADTDYADNIATILAGEHVSGRNVGILASLVSIYARQRELAIQRATAPKPATGYLAEVKTRVKTETRVTLRTVRFWEGDYGTTTFMVGYTPDLHCVVWKASGRHEVEAGDVLVLSAFTVKAHEKFGENGKAIDQTVITRAAVKEIVHSE